MSDTDQDPTVCSSRRRFFKGLTLIPLAAAAPGCGHSTQHLTDDDLHAIAAYLKTRPWMRPR